MPERTGGKQKSTLLPQAAAEPKAERHSRAAASGKRRVAARPGATTSADGRESAGGAKERGKARERSAGRFVAGTSGNPAGRPPGSRNKATLLAEQLVDGSAESVVERVIKAAKRGNVAAMKLVLERLLPKRKERPLSVRVPELMTAADLVTAYSEIIACCARGEMSIGEAEAFTRLLDRQRSAIETGELARKVAELEAEILRERP